MSFLCLVFSVFSVFAGDRYAASIRSRELKRFPKLIMLFVFFSARYFLFLSYFSGYNSTSFPSISCRVPGWRTPTHSLTRC